MLVCIDIQMNQLRSLVDIILLYQPNTNKTIVQKFNITCIFKNIIYFILFYFKEKHSSSESKTNTIIQNTYKEEGSMMTYYIILLTDLSDSNPCVFTHSIYINVLELNFINKQSRFCKQ